MIIGIFLSYAQNVGFDVQKKWYKLPELGGGGAGVGGRGNSGNARKKTFFFAGGVPLEALSSDNIERKAITPGAGI